MDLPLLPGSFQNKSPQTGGSNQEKLILSQCGGQKSEIKVRAGLRSLCILGEGPSCLFQPLGFAYRPAGSWAVVASPRFCLCLHVPPSPCKDTCHWT